MSKIVYVESINVICTVNNFDTNKDPFYISNFLNINWIGFSLSFLLTQHVAWYWTSFTIVSNTFEMMFRRKSNEEFTNLLATSNLFSPVLLNASLCNVTSFDRHMIQGSLLYSDAEERNLFLFVWGVLEINFLSEVLEISSVWFQMLLESSLLMSNLSLLPFILVIFCLYR